MAGKFVYKARGTAEWSARSDQKAGGYIGIFQSWVNVLAVQKSDNYIRFLPPTWDAANHYGYDVWVHYGVGPQNATVLCLAKANRGRCPICEAHAIAEAAGREDAKSLRAGRRVITWVLDLRDDKVKTPKVFSMPWSLDRDITKICKDKDSGELYAIDHPDEGYNVGFDREGDAPMVKYVGLQLARRASAVDASALDFIMEHPLPDTLVWRSYEEVAALFEGAGPSEVPNTAQAAQEVPAPVAEPVAQPATPPARRTIVTNMPGGKVTASAPPVQEVVEVPAEDEAAFCDKSFNFKGESFGCIYVLGHEGDCLFERELGAVAPPPPPPPPPTPRPVVAPARPVSPQSPQNNVSGARSAAASATTQPVAAAQPTAAAPAGNDRLAAMRNRFGANRQ